MKMAVKNLTEIHFSVDFPAGAKPSTSVITASGVGTAVAILRSGEIHGIALLLIY